MALKAKRFARAGYEILLVRCMFALLGRLSARLASEVALILFTTPKRRALRSFEQELLSKAEKVTLDFEGAELCLFRFEPAELRSEKSVVLLHGWEGRGTQMASFVEPLTSIGLRVYCYDAPAHGESSGKRTNLPAMSAALQRVFAELPDIRYSVSHSWGSICMAHAHANGAPLDAFVSIAAPVSVRAVIARFGKFLWLPKKARRSLEQLIESRFTDMDAASPPVTLAGSELSALIVHDEDDFEVPFPCLEQWKDILPQAETLETRGLGHRKILRDPDIVQAVQAFLSKQL